MNSPEAPLLTVVGVSPLARAQAGLRRLAALALAAAMLAGCGAADAPTVRTPSGASAPAEKAGGANTADVYRFAKISNGAYFYTGSAGERDIVLASYPDFRYEGVAFQQIVGSPGTQVFRFANLVTGGYFYTASPEERDFVRGTRPDMRYEGSTFSVATPASPGAVAVYRLANLGNGAYLYTSNASERDFAVGLGSWRSEGTAFFAPPASGFLNCPDDALSFNGTCLCNVSGYRYDSQNNACVLPASPDEPMRLFSGWAGDYVDGGGDGGGGDGGGGSGGGAGGSGGAGGGSSLGMLKRAKVEVYHPKNGTLFLAATGETDAIKGMFTLVPGSYTGPVLVVFKGQTGATYFDEALGTEVPFPEGRELNVMLASPTRNFGATPLTEAAYRYALQIYSDPRMSRDDNLVRILTPQRIQVASDLILNQFNALLPPSTQLTDIARLPYMIGPGTSAGSVPNTPNGLYALVLSSLAHAAKKYNDALVNAAVPSAVRTSAPASILMRQLALDLTDGRIDTFAGNDPVADTPQRLYSLSVIELNALKVSNGLTFPAMLAGGMQTSVTAYASPALAQAVGTIAIPPPPPLPPPVPPQPPSCSGVLYPLPGGGTGCCPIGSTVYQSASFSYCVPNGNGSGT